MTFTVRTAASGGWFALASGECLLLLPASEEARIGGAWDAVSGAGAFQACLDLLTSQGLAATPSFVLVEWTASGAARLIVRGEAALSVTDADGEHAVSATGVSTWVERSLTAVTALAFDVAGAKAATAPGLPLVDGVALIAGLSSAAAPAPATRAPERSTPAAAPKAATPVAAPVASVPDFTPPPAAAPSATPARGSAVTAAAQKHDLDIEATRREAPDADSPAARADASDGYSYLFGETMHRSVSEAAVREPVEGEGEGEPTAGDHDGETVLTSDIAKLRGKRRPKAAAAPKEAPAAAQGLVLVVSTTGAREPLTNTVLVGRNPAVSKVSGGQIPKLLTVGTADGDISRTHAQFSLEGGTVVVTDLHSRNGTSITLPGKSAQKLRAGEPTSVIVGTVVDFGSGLTLTVEEEPA